MSAIVDFINGPRDRNPALYDAVQRAVKIIRDAFHVYRPEELCFSFNGGKDSTVVLHLLRAVCASIEPPEGVQLFRRIDTVFFETPDNFPEVERFMQSTTETYGLKIHSLPSFKDGLNELLETSPVRAVFLGTRRSDPDGVHLEHFTPTSPGWPPLMRISPILSWHYSDVWEFLRMFSLPYCPLYDDGYTSLGSVGTTLPNPKLFVGESADGVLQYLPAYRLSDESDERAGRRKRAKEPRRDDDGNREEAERDVASMWSEEKWQVGDKEGGGAGEAVADGTAGQSNRDA